MGMRWLRPGWWRTLLGRCPTHAEYARAAGLSVLLPDPRRFTPGCRHESAHDALACRLEDVPYYVEAHRCGVELHRCERTGRVVGFRVWGLSGILRGEG
jgi:hypothetical protein